MSRKEGMPVSIKSAFDEKAWFEQGVPGILRETGRRLVIFLAVVFVTFAFLGVLFWLSVSPWSLLVTAFVILVCLVVIRIERYSILEMIDWLRGVRRPNSVTTSGSNEYYRVVIKSLLDKIISRLSDVTFMVKYELRVSEPQEQYKVYREISEEIGLLENMLAELGTYELLQVYSHGRYEVRDVILTIGKLKLLLDSRVVRSSELEALHAEISNRLGVMEFELLRLMYVAKVLHPGEKESGSEDSKKYY